MVLDHEVALALDALLRAPVVDDAECALDDIARLGPGGSFFDAALTAERCRTELFLPSTWSRELLGAWQRSGSRRDADRARERVAAFAHAYRPASLLSEGEERELAAIVARAARLVDGA
jgi:trimethylamine--corrinoid protein Co-methyltransferase